jgi:hypothetical protein
VLLAALVGALLHRVLLEQSHVDADFVDGVVDLVIAGAAPKDRGAHTETRRS